MKFFLFVLWASIASLPLVAAANLSSQPLQILSREQYDPRSFSITDEDWRWLGQKRELKVAVWQPEIPPISMFTQDGKFEGIASDYLMLTASYLGVRVKVISYPSQDAAYKAMSHHEVDLMLDASGKRWPFDGDFIYSNRFVSDHPVLVHPKLTAGENFTYQAGMRLAIARWYVDDDWISSNFPGARIVHFDTDEEALASVAFKRNDFFIGNLVTTSYLLERNYPNHLEYQTVYPERDTGTRFIVSRNDKILLRTLNAALNAIPSAQSQIIMQQWSEEADIWRLRKHIDLNEQERKWIQRHPQVRVSVNSFYAPFTMTDAGDNFYGVTADILKLVSQRTGIEFIPVAARSLEAMQTQLDRGETLFIGALSYSDDRNDRLLFSRPYFKSPFVEIIRANRDMPDDRSGLRIALVKGNPLLSTLQARHPGIKFVETPNASVAMQDVIEDKADIAIHTLFGASYMINRYFEGQLKIAGSLDAADGQIGFAVNRTQPELLGILNKALENISPSDINDIIKKWQTRPDVRLNTWELYRKQFWLVIGVATIILLTSLIWIFYMRREIVARKKAQSRLHSQLKFNETLIGTLPLPVYVTDLEGNLRLCNKSLSDFFGQPEHAFTGQTLNQDIHPLHSLWSNVTRQVSESGDAFQPLISHERIYDGERFRNILHYSVTFTDGSGMPDGFICTWLDMTEQEELNRELFEARERAEQANRAKSTFLATMSHEIRTPVSAIIGLLELVVKTSQSESDKNDTVKVAWESARSLMGLIGDILDMARIESGRLELTPEWVRTSDLLPPIVRVFEGLARQKSLRLRSSLPAQLPYEVFIDPLRFRQVLSNLVSNAIKFTDRGYIDVDLHIIHAGYDGDATLTISVRDTGKGLSPEEQEDIFSPWVQARAGRIQSGSGLGLAICSQLVDMMGGNIHMQSQLERGTTVTFTVPAAIRMERSEPENIPPQDFPDRHRRLRILAVDDHPANRLLLRHQLSHLGHDVTVASDGEEGWKCWQKDVFDVVITDCTMPGMDGLELTRLIRQHQNRNIIVLGLTANAWPEERARCIASGMDDCLFKPLQLPQLQMILDDASENLHQIADMENDATTVAEPEPSLEHLLNMNDLYTLTHNDKSMLRELLSVTLTSNREDLALAEDLFELEDWPELAKCMHRISGAAQIIGAVRAEGDCRLMEKSCLLSDAANENIILHWEAVQASVWELNRSIEAWINAFERAVH